MENTESLASNVEVSEQDGLTVIYDSETNIFTFEWDSETHPEYDYLNTLTSDSFSELLQDYLDGFIEKENTPEIPAGGPSCGTSESDVYSGLECGIQSCNCSIPTTEVRDS